MSVEPDRDFRQRMARVETLVGVMERCPDPTRQTARELVRALLDLHAAGLAQVLDLARETDPELVDRLARDRLVASLLLLHGLHPTPIETRVAEALERVRPRLRGRGGDAELLHADVEQVRVRLRGDASVGPELRAIVEQAVTDAAPDASDVAFEEAWEPARRHPLPLTPTGP